MSLILQFFDSCSHPWDDEWALAWWMLLNGLQDSCSVECCASARHHLVDLFFLLAGCAQHVQRWWDTVRQKTVTGGKCNARPISTRFPNWIGKWQFAAPECGAHACQAVISNVTMWVSGCLCFVTSGPGVGGVGRACWLMRAGEQWAAVHMRAGSRQQQMEAAAAAAGGCCWT